MTAVDAVVDFSKTTVDTGTTATVDDADAGVGSKVTALTVAEFTASPSDLATTSLGVVHWWRRPLMTGAGVVLLVAASDAATRARHGTGR